MALSIDWPDFFVQIARSGESSWRGHFCPIFVPRTFDVVARSFATNFFEIFVVAKERGQQIGPSARVTGRFRLRAPHCRIEYVITS